MEHEKYATCKPLTNGDKIRGMTDEELAEKASGMIVCFCCPVKGCRGRAPDDSDTCTNCWLKWLRSPVEESEK